MPPKLSHILANVPRQTPEVEPVPVGFIPIGARMAAPHSHTAAGPLYLPSPSSAGSTPWPQATAAEYGRDFLERSGDGAVAERISPVGIMPRTPTPNSIGVGSFGPFTEYLPPSVPLLRPDVRRGSPAPVVPPLQVGVSATPPRHSPVSPASVGRSGRISPLSNESLQSGVSPVLSPVLEELTGDDAAYVDELIQRVMQKNIDEYLGAVQAFAGGRPLLPEQAAVVKRLVEAPGPYPVLKRSDRKGDLSVEFTYEAAQEWLRRYGLQNDWVVCRYEGSANRFYMVDISRGLPGIQYVLHHIYPVNMVKLGWEAEARSWGNLWPMLPQQHQRLEQPGEIYQRTFLTNVQAPNRITAASRVATEFAGCCAREKHLEMRDEMKACLKASLHPRSGVTPVGLLSIAAMHGSLIGCQTVLQWWIQEQRKFFTAQELDIAWAHAREVVTSVAAQLGGEEAVQQALRGRQRTCDFLSHASRLAAERDRAIGSDSPLRQLAIRNITDREVFAWANTVASQHERIKQAALMRSDIIVLKLFKRFGFYNNHIEAGQAISEIKDVLNLITGDERFTSSELFHMGYAKVADRLRHQIDFLSRLFGHGGA